MGLFRFGDTLLEKNKILRFEKQKVIVKEENSIREGIVHWDIYAVLNETVYNAYSGSFNVKICESYLLEKDCEDRLNQLLADF